MILNLRIGGACWKYFRKYSSNNMMDLTKIVYDRQTSIVFLATYNSNIDEYVNKDSKIIGEGTRYLELSLVKVKNNGLIQGSYYLLINRLRREAIMTKYAKERTNSLPWFYKIPSLIDTVINPYDCVTVLRDYDIYGIPEYLINRFTVDKL